MTAQVKSRQRVQDHGEVFTNVREVNAMLDMVKQETERIESRFLEPACGDGNFLDEVLRRKLAVVGSRYRRSLAEWERYAFIAVGSIYGVELLADNVASCRERLYSIVEADYLRVCKKSPTPGYLEAIRYVLSRNILNGNALSLKAVDEHGDDTNEPIVFSEWSLVMGDKVKRRDFRLDEMLEGSADQQQFSLFGASGTPTSEWELDEETGAMTPKPIREFSMTSLYEVQNNE
ncbi:hypothetical protein J2S71_002386 [Olsenella profusa DSM 13989]|uniref:SAM-dependent DNA methyltransferase n=1 Tax=Olsenella profusa TaxID=138595 RepID=UPI00277D5DC7|nr:SAM-dependent DNA methyltransferase [Olsenella profusa]MDP9860690.1 hypothetical protein [Olsenella profusa DSM 13989]